MQNYLELLIDRRYTDQYVDLSTAVMKCLLQSQHDASS